ncbi:hypothetical protein EVJ58_g2149 [Rhodofomes roseus]|uniref:Uncharacterized protein n=1 Tax=Rhodofomes roseus TaxID=34475 RepID=A0A4Y9YUB5_9APHY|nr:hypothetical protein EVJ58_g2149 [Rhodofomes roseus]
MTILILSVRATHLIACTQGIIPGGTTFVLNPPTGPTDFEWIVDVASGTELMFFMTDSKGRSGGASQLDEVGLSGDPSCLTGAYPSSLSVHPSGTATAAASASAAGNTGTSSSPTGAIVGAVVGGVVGLGLVAAAVFLYLRKERRKGRYGQNGALPYRGTRPRSDEVDLAADGGDDVPPPHVVQPYPFFNPTGSIHSQGQQSIQPYPYFNPTGSVNSQGQQSIGGAQSTVSLIRPMSYAESQGYAHPDQYTHGVAVHSRNNSLVDGRSTFAGTQAGTRLSGISNPRTLASQTQTSQTPTTPTSQTPSQGLSSASRRKAAMAGVTPYQPAPPRFILHTDAEDVIELPPQYTSLRMPSALTQATDSDDRRASGSGNKLPPTYPPPPLSVNPEAAPPDSAGPPSSIIEEDHPPCRSAGAHGTVLGAITRLRTAVVRLKTNIACIPSRTVGDTTCIFKTNGHCSVPVARPSAPLISV